MKRSIIHLFLIFPLSFLTTFLFINFSSYNYTSSNISPSFLLFYLHITLTLNVTIPSSLHLLFILTLLRILFTIKICYSLFHSIHVFPTQKGEFSFSLSLSLSFILSYKSTLIDKFVFFFFNLYFGLIHFGGVFLCSPSHVHSFHLIVLVSIDSYIFSKCKFEFI